MEPSETDSQDGHEVRTRSRRRRKERGKKLRNDKRLKNVLYDLRWVAVGVVVGVPFLVGLLYLLHGF